LRHLRIKKQKEKQQRKQRREREKHSMGWVLSSALPRAARVLESGYIIVGGRPTAAPRSSNPRAHGVETWSRARRRRAAAYCRSRPCPGSRDGGADWRRRWRHDPVRRSLRISARMMRPRSLSHPRRAGSVTDYFTELCGLAGLHACS
jgi:hypothetical protein